ncbi:sulfotransferase [Glycomyces sp. L485]|uniref:sulfotransferase family protein n=1 Tax=Glycomyces sp. L485 TaxID=2909235 RepID=UPI001F4B71DD|nr:sulfotransferase [Glycomyces sp. L485]MCH7232284.1 sulfotransferase [Glycomyces sp. L485]
MPSIPTSTRLLNALLGPTVAGQRTPEHVFDLLLSKAEQAGGGTVEGDEAFLDGFRALLHSYSKVENMTAVGWQTALADLQLRVQNRLRVMRLLRERPAIGEEPIASPVFIVGLPRTATTLTREVIARAAGHRAPLLWEMFHTDLEQPERERKQRVKSLAQLLKSTRRLAPKYAAAHGFDPAKPDDCIHLLPHGTHHLRRADMPDYRDRLAGHDFAPDYDYLKRALQVLQHGRAPARWILDSPAHLDHLPLIRATFPDAVIVWIHRDPVTVIGSLCSLVETSMALHVRGPDLHRIGSTWLELTADSIERARKARTVLPRESIIDIPYASLMADPFGGTPMLYERIGARWTDADAANLDAALAGPGIGRAHEYELARYGLSTGDVERAFGDYPNTIQQLRMR